MGITLIGDCPCDYEILNGKENGSYTFEDNSDGSYDAIVFKVAWEDRFTFRTFAKGRTHVVSGSPVRDSPLRSPYTGWIYATRIRGRGMGSDNRVTNARPYPFVVMEVEFSPLKYDPTGGGPFQSTRYRATTSFATIPGATLQFSNGEYIDHDYGILLGQYSIEITQYQIPDVAALMANLKPIAGKVNSDVVTIDSTDYAPGFLLFPTFEGEQTLSVDGQRQEQATVNLIYRSIGWNNDIRSDGVVDSVSPIPYPSASMAWMFS